MGLQILEKLLIGHGGFTGTLLEGGMVLFVFPKKPLNGFIHEIGHASLHVRGLDPQGTVQLGLQVNRAAFCIACHDGHLY